MQRGSEKLSHGEYDVAIIGGGIYGAWAAWDAASRGLKVALVDQGDFASATSANSQKIIHGGLRYLQHADFARMRESIRERSILMRVAPHLASPLPCLIPSYKGQLSRGRLALSLALKLNDIISYDRNREVGQDNALPAARMVSRKECLELCSGLDPHGLTGGAIFYDGQLRHPERLILSILRSAAAAGADLANYTRVTGLIQEDNSVRGLQLKDVLTGRTHALRARITVNCGGPWIQRLLDLDPKLRETTPDRWFKAVVLVTRPVVQEVAVGVTAEHGYKDSDAVIDKGYRFFFIVPWRDTSLIGTFYDAFHGDPGTVAVTEVDIDGALQMTNAAYPGAKLTKQDVRYAYCGLLPRAEGGNSANDIQYAKHYEIHDHGNTDAVHGLISVMGVKFTTARDVAEKAIDLAARKLGCRSTRCRTAVTPVYGGDLERPIDFVRTAAKMENSTVNAATMWHLASTYGSASTEVLQLLREEPEWGERVASHSPTSKAEVVYGVRAEMAQTLSDTILRRTALGTGGYPGDECLANCATLMAGELGWSAAQIAGEIEDTKAIYRLYGKGP